MDVSGVLPPAAKRGSRIEVNGHLLLYMDVSGVSRPAAKIGTRIEATGHLLLYLLGIYILFGALTPSKCKPFFKICRVAVINAMRANLVDVSSTKNFVSL